MTPDTKGAVGPRREIDFDGRWNRTEARIARDLYGLVQALPRWKQVRAAEHTRSCDACGKQSFTDLLERGHLDQLMCCHSFALDLGT